MKIHTMFVIGKRDMDADAVSVRVHGRGNLGAKPRAEAIAEILQSIKERRAGKPAHSTNVIRHPPMFQVSMRTFLFVVFAFCVTYLCASLRAEEEIKYPSPNGALALRILDPEDASGKVEIGIMELSTHKVLLDFGGLGHPN